MIVIVLLVILAAVQFYVEEGSVVKYGDVLIKIDDSLKFINERKKEGIELNEAISQAVKQRFRPIMMTALLM